MERYRKFVVAALGTALLYAGIVFDVLGEADLSTTEGIVAAAVALATALGVYQVPNA
jgi:branched-subunit amino acid transport protein